MGQGFGAAAGEGGGSAQAHLDGIGVEVGALRRPRWALGLVRILNLSGKGEKRIPGAALVGGHGVSGASAMKTR